MKKVVVVFGEKKEFFEGEDLQVINKKMGTPVVTEQRSEYFLLEILIVKDGNEELGVFQKWDYWKKLDGVEKDKHKPDKDKIIRAREVT